MKFKEIIEAFTVMFGGVFIVVLWFFMIIYNMLLLFLPYGILHFVFEMRSGDAKLFGFAIGVLMLFMCGISPNVGKKD